MSTKKVLVYGGKGALGTVCVDAFKAQKWWVGSIASKANDAADANIIVDKQCDIFGQEKTIVDQLEASLCGEKVDAIICVAGGWAGGNAASKNFLQSVDVSYNQSAVTSAIAASLAVKVLKDGGLLTLTGSAAALNPTAGMMGYGMIKAAVHHLTKSLGAPGNGLPPGSTVAAVLPLTLDSPINRKNMPNADFSSFTPLDEVACLFVKWINNDSRPPSGSLVKLETANSKTQTKIV